MTDLLAELFLTQLVEGEELLGQHDVLQETTAGQLDTDDDGTVWNHHGHCAEVDLQVLWQLLAASVARVLWTMMQCFSSMLYVVGQEKCCLSW